ncbi:ABC transporter permease [Aneurinibacillus tyrosinisolvens]|uniref:ABC transporter permease n=1 Tax=Aneurinibacillus tyrosinisolvens TaxID=1443435 RepID=UPI00063F4207|nr:ABC transporter permease [Aneurinibacillus tyrosinisolvens]
MNTLNEAFGIIMKDGDKILKLTLEHIYMSFSGVLLAILLGVPIAIFMTKYRNLADLIQNIIGMIQTIPSIALLLIIMIFFGLGYTTAIVALVFYSLLPIIQNTYAGLSNVDRNLIEAGTGMGMTYTQLLFKVKIPLAFPVMMAGFRIATIIAIGVTTIATFVGAGGLGEMIYRGIATTDDAKVLAGSIPAALLAVCVDFILKMIEKRAGFNRHKKRLKSS